MRKRPSRLASDRAQKSLLCECAPSAPPAPDPGALASAQGAANVRAARVQGQINNPNIITPYGSQTVRWLDPNRAEITQTLSPELKGIFDRTLNTNVDFDRDLGTRQEGKQSVIDSLMRRYDTDLGRRREDMEATLIARGIPRGSEAFNREMEMLDRGRNDAFQQATLTADARSLDDRRQAITELLAERQTPLQEINALRSGSQISPVQFQGGNVAPTDVMGAHQMSLAAQQNAFNQAMGARNANLSGLFGLGAAYLMSDRRLKSNIVRIGTHPLGIGIYEYDIFGARAVGVMADEVERVMPEAVLEVGGYKAVNYALL